MVTTPWQDIATAPKDGTRFTGKLRNTRRRTWYGKVSHVPIYGWCHGRDVENIDLWRPTHWLPDPPEPIRETK